MAQPNLITTLSRFKAPFVPVETKVLTSATPSLTFSGLDTSVYPLYRLDFAIHNDTSATSIGIRCNNDSGANYDRLPLDFTSGTPATGGVRRYQQALTPSSVSANSTSEQSFTVTGLLESQPVFVSKPSHQSGLGIVNARASAANTLNITFVNVTGSPITPTSETYLISQTEASISNSGMTFTAKETGQQSFICSPLFSTNEFYSGFLLIQQHQQTITQKVGFFSIGGTNTPDFHLYNGSWNGSSAKLTSLVITGMVTHNSAFGSFGAGSRFVLSGMAA